MPFRLTAPAEDLRLPRAYGAIPIAVEVLSARGTSIAVIRTFVGWQRSKDYVPLALAWLLPVTLAPDPAPVSYTHLDVYKRQPRGYSTAARQRAFRIRRRAAVS